MYYLKNKKKEKQATLGEEYTVLFSGPYSKPES